VGFVPALGRHAGGVFQYSAAMTTALTEIAAADRRVEPVALLPTDGAYDGSALRAAGWSTASLMPPAGALRRALGKAIGEGAHRDALRRLRGLAGARSRGAPGPTDLSVIAHRGDLAAWWRQQRVDLVLFPQPHPFAFEVGLPYVIAVHDLQHRLQPEFEEVSGDGEWSRREYILRNCIARAERVLVDSDVGKEHVLFFYEAYGARAERVDVLPFVPVAAVTRAVGAEEQLGVRRRHGIPDQYLLYPAAFWPHKNHARIIEALERLANARGMRVHAVFCGSHTDPLRERHFRLLMDMAAQCGVSAQVHVPGYVSVDELAALYAGASALVMPTFFGPTNIPVIEAWAHGCPVLTSDIPGIREQVGDAAILVEPRAVDALADAIHRLLTDAALRRDLAVRGMARLSGYTPLQFRQRLHDTLLRASGRPPTAVAASSAGAGR
jgi:glycosyltransferase involved in cell wall biosynthesis